MIRATLQFNPVINALSVQLKSSTDKTPNEFFLQRELRYLVQNKTFNDYSLPSVRIAMNTYFLWYFLQKQTASLPFNNSEYNIRRIEEFLELLQEKEARRK